MPVVFALTLAAIGALYQTIGLWLDGRRFPQRGSSFSVSGIRMNLNCMGNGKPAVVLDSGMAGTSLDWVRVQPEVAKFTRVCSYDRPGYGWSDPSPSPRTSRQIAFELKALLQSAGEQGPFVLVGHSFGGYNVRMLSKLYPADVAGVVLVDAEHPGEEALLKTWQDNLPSALKARIERDDKQREFWNRFIEPMRLHLGIDRLRLALGGRYARSMPIDLQSEILFLEQQPKFIAAVEEENRLDAQSAAQVRGAGTLGDRPLIVLTAGAPYAGDPNDHLLTEEQKANRDGLWIHRLQAEYVHLSSRARQSVVSGSGHDMPSDRPDAIVAAVHDVWGLLQ